MPNQNQPDPNQNSTQEPTSPVNSYGSQVDLPPLPPDFQNVEAAPVNPMSEAPKENMGSAAPPSVPPVPNINSVASLPKKKFGTGKIIATILSILLVVGGVGAGTYLVGQKQFFQQKAASCDGSCRTNCNEDEQGDGNGTGAAAGCSAGQYCCVGGGNVTPPSSDTCSSSLPTASVCQGKSYGYIADSNWTSTGSENCTNGAQLVCEYSSGSNYCAANVKCKTDSGGGGGTVPTATPKTGWGTGKTCSNGVGTGDHCILITCPNGCSGGCSEGDPGATVVSGSCSDLSVQVSSVCGQVDLVNSSGAYCQSDGTFTDAQINCPQPKCAVKPTNPPSTTTPTTTPTATPTAPYCAAVTTYKEDWTLIAATDRASLTAGTVINFCVGGAAPSGTFDMARFTINGVLQADTTTQRPSSTDFCQSYTIPTGATTIAVSAQIHHSTLGWF